MEEARVRMELRVQPQYARDLDAGIRAVLDAYIAVHVEELNGVLLAYWDATPDSSTGLLVRELPYIFVTVTFTALLFTPRAGMRVEGTVVQVGADHIGLLVLGLFHASIPLRDSDAAAAAAAAAGLARDASALQEGVRLPFRIHGTRSQRGMLSLKGALD